MRFFAFLAAAVAYGAISGLLGFTGWAFHLSVVVFVLVGVLVLNRA